MISWLKPSTWYKKVFQLMTRFSKQPIIIFESFAGRSYSDNPKALYEYAKEHYPNYELLWHVKKTEVEHFKKLEIPYYTTPSFQELFKQTRAKYWIINARTPKWKKPGKETKFLQTWHGTPLKKLGVDIEKVTMPGTTTKEYRKNFLEDTNKWTYLLAQNEYAKEIFHHAFQVPKEKILVTGYPRNDKLITATSTDILNIKKNLGLELDKKVVLYAPTWRDTQNHGQGNYYLNLALDIEKFKQKFPDTYLLIRAHYLISEQLEIKNEKYIKDVSCDIDISDLYLISDLLITDYSSVFFDYAILERPMLFYAYDYDEYKDEMRGFYFDYQDVPGSIVKTMPELLVEVDRLLGEKKIEDLSFKAKYCSFDDGYASARVFAKLMEE